MKRASIAALILFVGFWFLPSSPVAETFPQETTYKNERVYAFNQATSGRTWGDPLNPEPNIRKSLVRKSGLRMAVEGRLKWLGLVDGFHIALPCNTSESGQITCRRLL